MTRQRERPTRNATRSCAACRYWSDLKARISRIGTVEAKCLNMKSQYHGKFRGEDRLCAGLAKGEAIDVPREEAAE